MDTIIKSIYTNDTKDSNKLLIIFFGFIATVDNC